MLVGVADGAQRNVGGWIAARRGRRTARAALGPLPLHSPGPLRDAFLRPGRVVDGVLGGEPVGLVGLHYRGQPVGAVAVSGGPLDPGRARLLERFAVHAAEALAGVRLCVDRAQRLAVEAERNRISVEMHDAVVQSLFAIAQSLAGCRALVERGDPEAVLELNRMQGLASRTLEQLRRSIHDMWPGELLERQFVADLREHLEDVSGLAPAPQLVVDVEGSLATLSPRVRRALYRVAQEALSNVVRHAAASRVSIRLDTSSDPVRLTIADDGCGEAGSVGAASIGQSGMRDRLAAIAGGLSIRATPGAGTCVVATVPRESACGAA